MLNERDLSVTTGGFNKVWPQHSLATLLPAGRQWCGAEGGENGKVGGRERGGGAPLRRSLEKAECN